jgi:hypothetical protein
MGRKQLLTPAEAHDRFWAESGTALGLETPGANSSSRPGAEVLRNSAVQWLGKCSSLA